MSGPSRTEQVVMAGLTAAAATLCTKAAEWLWERITHKPECHCDETPKAEQQATHATPN